MIKQKEKKCVRCEGMKFLFGYGMCKACYNIVYSKPIISKMKPIVSKKKYIRLVSKKQKERLVGYNMLRESYLLKTPICERCKVASATEIHHPKGRDGNNLFDYMLAVCRTCHIWIENNPIEAKEQGFSHTRLSKD